jgi:predicted PurR-regulated permease PerM
MSSPPAKIDLSAEPTGPRVTRNWIITASMVVIAICIGGAALAYMRDILTPLLIAIFLYFLIQPLVEMLFRWRLPPVLLYVVMVTLPVLAVLFLAWMIDINVRAFAAQLPDYRDKVQVRLDTLADRLNIPTNESGQFDWTPYLLDEKAQQSLVTSTLAATLKGIEISVLVVFYLLFIFLEARKFRGRVKSGFEPETANRIVGLMDTIDDSIRGYLWIKTGVSIGLGLTTAILGWLFGLDFWLLWGFLMFLLNYITYVGSIAALVPPIAVAFVQFNSPVAAAILTTLLILNRLFWIDYAEIRYSGEHLDVSPLLLLLSIALLGWIWGVVGMLLAVPLVTSTKIVLSHFDNTRQIAKLMSDD